MKLINPISKSSRPRKYHNCVKSYCYCTGYVKNIPDRNDNNIPNINLVGVWKKKMRFEDSKLQIKQNLLKTKLIITNHARTEKIPPEKISNY